MSIAYLTLRSASSGSPSWAGFSLRWARVRVLLGDSPCRMRVSVRVDRRRVSYLSVCLAVPLGFLLSPTSSLSAGEVFATRLILQDA